MLSWFILLDKWLTDAALGLPPGKLLCLMYSSRPKCSRVEPWLVAVACRWESSAFISPDRRSAAARSVPALDLPRVTKAGWSLAKAPCPDKWALLGGLGRSVPLLIGKCCLGGGPGPIANLDSLTKPDTCTFSVEELLLEYSFGQESCIEDFGEGSFDEESFVELWDVEDLFPLESRTKIGHLCPHSTLWCLETSSSSVPDIIPCLASRERISKYPTRPLRELCSNACLSPEACSSKCCRRQERISVGVMCS